jgi:hypothetical protein
MTRYTYQHLLELVDGDDELIARLVEEGEIVRRDDGDIVTLDVERVLVARTLLRELEVDWPGIEVILRLRDELLRARRRIAELEKSGGDDVNK